MPHSENEFEIIEQIKRQLGEPSNNVEIGIGDDAAIVRAPQHKMLLCSDALVQDVHFDLNFISPEELGHKALVSCLSDIAAMNGTPLYALVSLAITKELTKDSFVNQFYRGLGALASTHKVDVVGGDLTHSPHGVFIDISLVGETKYPFTRSGAKVGDLVAVSGHPGTSAAGLSALKRKPKHEVANILKSAHLRPTPRFDLLAELNKTSGLCTSMIDISDGLSSELHHLAKASKTGFEIEASKFPLREETIEECGSRNAAIQLALSGGEDYELLATFDYQAWNNPKGWTVIGRVTEAASGLMIRYDEHRSETLVATGYNHFKL